MFLCLNGGIVLKMERIEKLNHQDHITIELFGQRKEVEILSFGDNQFDEEGNYKNDKYALSDEEISCLNWFIQNIKIEDYKQEIVQYCNEIYDNIGEKTMKEEDVENEIDLHSIAINITKNFQANDGSIYPEISYCGECKCDPEHGICIGFRDKKFLGIESQDWTL